MPVLFNVFEVWNEESVVLDISFCFICNQLLITERPIRFLFRRIVMANLIQIQIVMPDSV